VRIAGSSLNFTQGTAQLTGRSTDLSISGDGFFVVRSSNGEALYTRLGAFGFDAAGKLVSPDGSVVQGWPAVNGAVNANAEPSDLVLPLTQSLPPSATRNVSVAGNLPADITTAPVGTVINTSVTTYDSQGVQVPLTLQMTKTAVDTWDVQPMVNGTAAGAATTVTFDPVTGALATTSPTSVALAAADFAAAGAPNAGPVTIDFSTVTEFGSARTVTIGSQDGYAMGSLQSFNIGPDGTITGVFTNGLNQPIGRVALAAFTNPQGLEKVGDSTYRTSVNSGLPDVGTAGTGGRGKLSGGTLEMSNVDLAAEFTNLIIAQRGFQANSRVITASDELLQDLVNLKR
jgi:flagellar hook protein FlgE